jgi:hypothetical protein
VVDRVRPRLATDLRGMHPKPVVRGDPAPQDSLVADQAFGYAPRDITAWNGDFSIPEPVRVFERLLSLKGATTMVHRGSRIPSEAA